MEAKPSSARSRRRGRAVESFKTAAECIGPVEPGLAVFAVTRGQFSMLDAVLHVLNCTGRAKVSLWTWTIADYEAEVFRDLMACGKIEAGTLVIDADVRRKSRGGSRDAGALSEDSLGAQLCREWQSSFGPQSVRLCKNHAKIATVEGGGFRVLLRGSMNLNYNPRFEQLDVTEGGADFDLVRQIETELECLPFDAPSTEVVRVSNLGKAFKPEQLAMFQGLKVWAK